MASRHGQGGGAAPPFTRFVETADAAPRAAAVRCDGHVVTYGELAARVESVAGDLRSAGVGPGTYVGVLLPPGVDAIVSILAVAACGAAYASFDVATPADRLATMIDDVEPVLVVTSEPLVAVATAAGATARVVTAGPAGERSRSPLPPVRPDDAAYVIFTSGSTGRPKGVVVENRNLSWLLDAGRETATIVEGATYALLHSLAFDVSVWEMWSALTSTGTLVVVPPDVARAPELLAELIVRERIELLTVTPSAFRHLVRPLCASGARASALRSIVFCGEPLQWVHLEDWARQGDDAVRLVNMYGITETTVHSSIAEVDLRGDRAEPPHVGVALPGATLDVLDGDEPAPVGVVGEIVVGGGGVTRGYLCQPASTAERFEPVPGGARRYRSGDLGRRLADGTIAYVGRRDTQVKIRGFRVECGDVVAALGRIAGVRGAVVSAVPARGSGDPRLVAFVVADGDVHASLRDQLRAMLPPYMIPARFVAVDAIPTTRNGKADVAALLAAHEREADADAGESLAALWADVLEIDDVAEDDDFFELGGDSFAAAELAELIRAVLHRDVAVTDILEHPSLRDLERVVARRPAPRGAPAPLRAAVPEPFELSLGQQTIWLVEQLRRDANPYQSQSFIRFRGRLDVERLKGALEALLARYEILRTTFHAAGGVPRQVVHERAVFDFDVVDASHVAPAELAEHELAKPALHARFDLERLPLIRWVLFVHAPDDHTLLHVEHHLVHDGWSFNRLVADMLQAYERGPSSLEAPARQYRDFVAWQQRWLDSPAATRQARHWSAIVRRIEAPTPVPGATPVAGRTYRGAALRTTVGADVVASLAAAARHRRVSTFELATAGFVSAFRDLSSASDVVIGSALGNRSVPGVSDVVGMVVNPVVLAVGPDDDVVGCVSRTVREARAHEQLPFERVLRMATARPALDGNPYFASMFSFHDSRLPVFGSPEVDVSVIPGVNNGSARFDLNVIVVPVPRACDPARGHDGSWEIMWEYSTDALDEARARAVVDAFERSLVDLSSSAEGARRARSR